MPQPPNLFDLTGKVTVVTGAGFGLGRVFARAFAEFGADVVCTDRDVDTLEETVALIKKAGGRASALRVDVAERASVVAMAESVKASHGRADVLMNNAGIATVPARVHEMPIEDWDRLIAINLTGVFLCTRAVLPLMLAAGGGSIISIASIIGIVGQYPDFPMVAANYAAAKAGVIGFTRQLAVEYAKDKIRANAIAPGWHGGTRLGAARRRNTAPGEIDRFETEIVEGTPMGRRGLPEELSGLAVYLASSASSYLTGQVIVHDGGWTAT